jgi:membrane associated rhomboid family serine protease
MASGAEDRKRHGEPRTAPRSSHGLVTVEWLDALRRGHRPMTATWALVGVCIAAWLTSLAAGGSLVASAARGPVDHALARNANLIAMGQWWRALTYGTLNLSVFALVWVMALLLLAGRQLERTYGTARYLAILIPSWTTGAVTGLLVEPAHAFNAGTSAATLGLTTAATIDLLRRGVPWYRTFWAPVTAIILLLGLLLPSSVTWGAHAGGISAGAVVGAVACHPTRLQNRRQLTWTVILATVITAGSLLAVPPAARHTTQHGPILIGAPTRLLGPEADVHPSRLALTCAPEILHTTVANFESTSTHANTAPKDG